MTDYEPLTPVQTEQRMRQISGRLLDVVNEHRALTERLAEAKADYHDAFHRAHLESMVDHPKRKVSEHQSYAEMAAAGEHRRMVALEEMDKALRHEAHSLRQVLSSLQTNQRSMAGIMGESR